jgi:hypothetical protein
MDFLDSSDSTMMDITIANTEDLLAFFFTGIFLTTGFSLLLFVAIHNHMRQRFQTIMDANAELRGDIIHARISNSIVLQNVRQMTKSNEETQVHVSQSNANANANLLEWLGVMKASLQDAEDLRCHIHQRHEAAMQMCQHVQDVCNIVVNVSNSNRAHVLQVRDNIHATHRRIAKIGTKIAANTRHVAEAADKADASAQDVWDVQQQLVVTGNELRNVMRSVDNAVASAHDLMATTQRQADETAKMLTSCVLAQPANDPQENDDTEDVIEFEDEDEQEDPSAAREDSEFEPTEDDVVDATKVDLPRSSSTIRVVTRGSSWVSPNETA